MLACIPYSQQKTKLSISADFSGFHELCQLKLNLKFYNSPTT